MTAPQARRVDALTGNVASEKFFQALSEADSFVAELDTLRELQCRVQELEAELHDWKLAAAAEADGLNRMTAERDVLAARLKRMQATR